MSQPEGTPPRFSQVDAGAAEFTLSAFVVTTNHILGMALVVLDDDDRDRFETASPFLV